MNWRTMTVLEKSGIFSDPLHVKDEEVTYNIKGNGPMMIGKVTIKLNNDKYTIILDNGLGEKTSSEPFSINYPGQLPKRIFSFVFEKVWKND